jgi:hypothetical protein
MLLGVGILSNSLIYVAVIMPVFLFIYQAIVLAEENFLRGKFGKSFDDYCSRVNRWIPSLQGIGKTFSGMRFNWKRWILKEYNTQFVWMAGIVLIILFRYPQLTGNNVAVRNMWLYILIPALGIYYGTVRYLKKSGKVTE